MQKNTIIAIIVLIALAVGGYFLVTRYAPEAEVAGNQEGAETATGEDRALAGPIMEIDSRGIAADGPYLITILTSSNEEATIAIPSMGLPLCAAQGTIADPVSISVGETIEVRGTVEEDGTIVPCESPDHYFRLATEQKG